MEVKAILKKISIKNNDTDTYASVQFDLDTTDLDINKLASQRHKHLTLKIEEGEDD